MRGPMQHKTSQETLDALFLEEDVRGEAVLQAQAHLRGCAPCRDYFDELAEADDVMRDLGASEDDVSDAEHGADALTFAQRYSLRVMEAQRWEAAQAPAADGLFQRALAWLRGGLGRPALLAAGSALAVLLAVLIGGLGDTSDPVAGQGDDPGLQARGVAPSAGAPNAEAKPTAWVEVFCARKDAQGQVRFNALDPNTKRLSCGARDELKFALVNSGVEGHSAWRYVALVGVPHGAGDPVVYQPVGVEGRGSASLPIQEARRLGPLGETIRVEAHHAEGGAVRVFGVFSHAPLADRALRYALRRAMDEGADDAKAAPALDGVALSAPRGSARRLGADGAGGYAVSTVELEVTPAQP